MDTSQAADPSSDNMLALAPPTTIYAIRNGRGVSNGIFLRYDDCRKFIENNDAEYSVFQNMNDAFTYLNADSSVCQGGNSPNDNGANAVNLMATKTEDAMPITFTHNHDNGANAVNLMATKTEDAMPYTFTHNHDNGANAVNLMATKTEDAMPSTFTHNHNARLTRTTLPGKKPTRVSVMSSFSKHAKRRIKADINPKRRPTKAWEKMFEQFKNHVQEKGTPHVQSIDDPALNKWTRQQETEYRNLQDGRGSSMFQAKIDELQHAGFKFTYVSIQDRYAMLYKFREDHGHFNVPPSNPLHKWVEKHRITAKKFSKGDSAAYFDMRLKELMALGVHASTQVLSEPMGDDNQLAWEHDQNWDHYFNQILNMQQENDHCDVSKEEDSELYAWVQRQHQEYLKIADGKPNHLTLERVQKLTDIGFIFEKRKQSVKWEERVKQLKRFQEKYGHVRVPKSDPELGVFVNRQRYEYTKMMAGKPSSMNEERLNELKALDFVFQAGKTPKNAHKKPWEERYQELVEYQGTHGTTMVPQQTPGLGEWVHSQRAYYKKLKQGKPSTLTPDRLLLLANLGFVFDATKKKAYLVNSNSTNKAIPSLSIPITRFGGRAMDVPQIPPAFDLPLPPSALRSPDRQNQQMAQIQVGGGTVTLPKFENRNIDHAQYQNSQVSNAGFSFEQGSGSSEKNTCTFFGSETIKVKKL